MAGAPISSSLSSSEVQPQKYTVQLIVLTGLFFMWGFITCLNDILIPDLKSTFTLTHFQAMLVQFAFFMAYFIGALLYFIISVNFGDPISKIGYKNGLMIGLVVSAIGCSLFYPAAQFHAYSFFLGALFVLGLGFTVLQIAANPYVAILGPAQTATSRLNLSQGFNSFGTTIAPLIGGFFIFTYFPKTLGIEGVEKLKIFYVMLAFLFIILAFIIKLTHLPDFKHQEKIEKGAGALQYRHLVLGMVAIFMYVGGEVTIGSILISFLEQPTIAGLTKEKADIFLAFYWGGAMIGRFLGSISLSDIPTIKKMISMLIVSTSVFILIFLLANLKSGGELKFQEVAPYIIILVLNFIAFLLGKYTPARTLGIFAVVVIGLLLITILGTGKWAMWSVIGIGLFNSVMWSNIFTLAISDLGKYTSQGSSLLIMMILGGALIPPLQGLVAEINIQSSFWIPVICYTYIAFYGIEGYKVKIIRKK
ncbi:MAG: sugar MFS transporter [Cytophagales bacterium]|nr:sugar MFS transporter [Cytophagales bacterium]MDW8384371.1 sugar MFS transporter [Flammeovirgaceae bacterium]